MFNRKLCTGSAVLACLTLFRVATAAPALQVLYHERLDFTPRTNAQGQQHVSFDAYGRHFDINLELNENIRRGVSANRSDIKPYRGTVTGQSGSWVRLTQTREGWRGVISDGHELYAIEPESSLQTASMKSTAVVAGASSAAPVMYRLADTLMPDGPGYCGTEDDESLAPGAGQASALSEFAHVAKDLSQKDTTQATTKELVVGVVADHEFTDSVGSDPEGAIVARMDVVDGIWYSQVGIEIVLGPVNVLTDANDTFSSSTDPQTLLSEVAKYRSTLPSSDGSALTHLMTGRTMDGNIIGISYLNAVCDSEYSSSLSQSSASTTVGALVLAHELGHSFNSVHDGVAGACSSTPQTYLMAPTINFSNQFSSCSLGQINARVASASCLKTVAAPTTSSSSDSGTTSTTSTGSDSSTSSSSSSGNGDTVSAPTSSGTTTTSGSTTTTSSSGSSGGGGGSLDLAWLAFLGTMVVLQWARLQRARSLLPRRAETTLNETRIQCRPDDLAHHRNGGARDARLSSARVAPQSRSH